MKGGKYILLGFLPGVGGVLQVLGHGLVHGGGELEELGLATLSSV